MIRKLCTTGALVAGLVGLMGATTGTALADTPHAVKADTACTLTGGGIGDLIGGVCRPEGRFGGHFGGHFGGGFFRGGFYRHSWGGPVLSFDQVSSACGCSGSSIPAGYVLVEDPQPVTFTQIPVVPVGGIQTGDGSCLGRLGGWFGGVWHRFGGHHWTHPLPR